MKRMFFVAYKKEFTKLKQFTFTLYWFYLLLYDLYFIYKNNEFCKFMKCTALKMKGKMISFKLQLATITTYVYC